MIVISTCLILSIYNSVKKVFSAYLQQTLSNIFYVFRREEETNFANLDLNQYLDIRLVDNTPPLICLANV